MCEPDWRLQQRTIVLGLLLALISPGCRTVPNQRLSRYEFDQPQMGVPFRIVLYAPDVLRAEAGAKAAFARVSQLNRRLSDYDYDSELNRLARTAGSGQAVKLSEDLWRVLARAQQMAQRSRGAFDVTVGPCVSLWRKARREGRLPDPARLAAARQAVGYRRLRLDARRRTACLSAANMRLDLGGIAKGYALDEALKVLYAHRLRRALVSGGGDMVAGEPPPGKPGWRIEVAPLDVTNAPPPGYVSLARSGLATSGDVFQHLEIQGRRYSHIVDPRTGIGLTDHSLVTVIARDGMTADSLSTAVSVLGPARGRQLVERMPGAAALIVRKPGQQVEVVTTSRFSKHLERPSQKTAFNPGDKSAPPPRAPTAPPGGR